MTSPPRRYTDISKSASPLCTAAYCGCTALHPWEYTHFNNIPTTFPCTWTSLTAAASRQRPLELATMLLPVRRVVTMLVEC